VVVNRPSQVPATGPEPAAPRLRMLSAPSTFPQLLEQCTFPHGDRIFLPRRRAQVDESVTFAGLLADIDALAIALLQLGLGRGDRIGLIAENRSEWLLVDQALASIGAIDVPRGADTSPQELQFILRHSGCRAAFADDDRTARELHSMRSALPGLERIVVMQDHTEVPSTLALGDLLRQGHAQRSAQADRLRAARAEVRPDDLLTIVYTSGTTAEPKGVMLTHQNVLSNVAVVTKALAITAADSFLSVLPAWHMYERIMDYLALATGAQLLYTDRRHIKEDLVKLQPTVFAAVPRIWEMLHDGIVSQSLKLTGTKGRLLRLGLRTARAVGAGKANGLDRLLHKALEPLVFRKVRQNLGGRLRLCVSGGGSLPRHVDETLLGLGLPLKNGYGLTETSPVAAVRLPHHRTPGHIGPPLAHTEIQARKADGGVCANGETGVLWIKGPQVMRGYYQNPSRTSEALSSDGWFNSGDLGHIDRDGNVWITGRAKDTIVLASGENVEPEPVETVIKTSPFIDQAVCVGQDQKAIGALLVPNLEALEQRIARAQWDLRDGLLHGKPVQALLRAELDRLLVRDNGIRAIDRVATLRVLAEPLTAENGMLTQTLKVRRHVVAERLAPVIASMFQSPN
jgi:long-chain acyl-CoA synthetase